MRILFISTFYPPHVIGGWEQLVQEINQHLHDRGHQTHVLTSVHGVDAPVREADAGVDRVLTLEGDLHHYRPRQFLSYRQRLRQNLAETRATIAQFQPDIVFVHIMWNLHPAIPWLAEQLLPGRVVFYVADHWLYAPNPHESYWRDAPKHWPARLAKRLLAPLPLAVTRRDWRRYWPAFERVLCVSQAIRQDLRQNTKMPDGRLHVVYNGIDTRLFVPAAADRNSHRKHEIGMLYAGSLVWHKGVHTAIEAMAILAERQQLEGLTLTIVGSGHPSYEARLRDMIRDAGLETAVTFRGRVPRDEMPALLQAFEVLIFPSTWEEPLARMTQEAMSAGLVVIGTTTGGTKEILLEGETGLTFPAEDAAALADQIWRLRQDPALLTQLAHTAREQVVERFDIRRMIDEIETHLRQVVHA